VVPARLHGLAERARGLALLTYGALRYARLVAINTGKRVLRPMTSPKQGINNINKCVDGLIAGAKAIQQAGSDGWELTDAGLVIRNREAMDKMADALDAVSGIGPEVNDLDFAEIIQLASTLPARLADLVPRR
jgi:hypothetical protein